MGMCQSCHSSVVEDVKQEEKDDILNPVIEGSSNEQRRRSDSALDSSHSDEDEAGPCRGNANKKITLNNESHESHSSESSGKYSMRESISSSVSYENQSKRKNSVDEIPESPGSSENNDDVFQFPLTPPLPQSSNTARDMKLRNISWESTESDNISRSSMTNVAAAIRAKFQRSFSLKESYNPPQLEEVTKDTTRRRKRAQRTVSLRLPREQRHEDEDMDTKLPTIYFDDEEKPSGFRGERRSSLNMALSLLSINSSRRSSLTEKPQKPVQRILRQPTRRHQTVRGISGLAIDGSRQPPSMNNRLQHSSTLYYPTVVSMRQTSERRYLYSS